MSELRYIGYDETGTMRNRPATPSEIANAFWSLWWGASRKTTPNQLEAVQTACNVVRELTGAPDET